MRKTVYTLNVNGFSPEITAITYPLIRFWADRIGADFHIITERRFPEWPVTYEKLQIYRIAEERDDEWSIYVDSDAIVHPETLDWTAFLPRDTVAHNGTDMAAIRWRYDTYFLRDGRNIGSCNWMTIASQWCRDLWRPIEDLTPAEAIGNIFPTIEEMNTVITPEHLVDDYALSRNVARYGLKVKTIKQILADLGLDGANFFWHLYTFTVQEKVRMMREVLDAWKIPEAIRTYGT